MPDSSPVFKWHLNSGQFVRYSNGGLNNGPLNYRTDPHDLNTGLVRYSDPHCTRDLNNGHPNTRIILL